MKRKEREKKRQDQKQHKLTSLHVLKNFHKDFVAMNFEFIYPRNFEETTGKIRLRWHNHVTYICVSLFLLYKFWQIHT